MRSVAQAAQSPWGVASNGRILDEPRLRSMEEMIFQIKAGRRCPGARMIFARKPAFDTMAHCRCGAMAITRQRSYRVRRSARTWAISVPVAG